MPVERAMLYPNHEELLAVALCAEPDKLAANDVTKVKVRIVHGSLEFASYPILAGHYCGDTLAGAEAALDRHLGGRLLATQRLGLYPGEINTAHFFPNDGRKPRGAIIIGLGEIGAITPGLLEKLSVAGHSGIRDQPSGRAGKCQRIASWMQCAVDRTNGAGLSMTTSIAAILRGIDKALQSLEKHGLGDRLILEEIELIEIYEDIAIHAAHALEDASKDADLIRRFDFDSKVQVDRRRGAMRRASTKG